MSPTDYIIDLLLIGLVLRQIRRRTLTTRSIVLPFVLIAVAGLNYLRPFRIGGNDLALIVLLTTVGTTLGALSGSGNLSRAARSRSLATTLFRSSTGARPARRRTSAVL